MLIIGCDFDPGFQQVAIFDNRAGEIQEKRLQHRAEAEQFYGALAGQEVRVGMEACGHYPWFELWFGDGARVRASVVRKQKTDRRDAEPLLDLLRQDRFPRIWVPSLEVRDVRQLLVHRHKQVQARTRTKNQLHAMALSHGVQKSGSFLLVEAGQTAARYDPQLKRFYRRLVVRKNRGVAKVAVARKLATRLYLMLREDWTYPQLCQAVMQVSPSHSVAGE